MHSLIIHILGINQRVLKYGGEYPFSCLHLLHQLGNHHEMLKRITIVFFLDILAQVFALLFAIVLKPASLAYYVSTYFLPLLSLLLLWQLAAAIFGKYGIGRHKTILGAISIVFLSNLVAVVAFIAVKNIFPIISFSRFVIFSSSGMLTIAEFILFGLAELVYHKEELPGIDVDLQEEFVASMSTAFKEPKINLTELTKHRRTGKIVKEIEEEAGSNAYDFIAKFVEVKEGATSILSTTTVFNVELLPGKKYGAIVNLKRINDIRYINKFIEAINAKLCHAGIFIGCVETQELRKKRILHKFPWGISHVYYLFDFVLKRIFPKFPVTKQIYFFLTRGQNRVISKAETLGRLYSCGFVVLGEDEFDGRFWFAAAKEKKPAFDLTPTYGPLIRLKRIGKGGKSIKVYKMRTMHPYAEYLQEYIYQKNKLDVGGKFKDDFRVTTLGRFMRKFWLDELPMLLNFLRGDLKIVGVRPLSSHYYSLYSAELQEKRIQTKPGLIPPFYADLPNSLEEIMASEEKYLDAHKKAPFRTDLRYFFKALYNIIIKRSRSK